MSRRVYRRRRKKPRRKKWPLVVISIVLLAGLALAASIALGYNPLLASQLRAQYGDDFFSEFGVSAPESGGGEQDLDSIIDAYEPAFEELEDKAMERLESLFQAALNEYHKQDKDGTVDRFVLTNKYIQAGRMLENSVDIVFYELLEEMESDLIAGGHALDVLEEIEETYEQAKAEKKRRLLQRLRQEIGS